MVEPVKGFFDFGEGESSFAVFEWAFAKGFKAVGYDGEEGFVADAVDAGFLDGALLETDFALGSGQAGVFEGKLFNGMEEGGADFVVVAGAAGAGAVGGDSELLVVLVDLVCGDGAWEHGRKDVRGSRTDRANRVSGEG